MPSHRVGAPRPEGRYRATPQTLEPHRIGTGHDAERLPAALGTGEDFRFSDPRRSPAGQTFDHVRLLQDPVLGATAIVAAEQHDVARAQRATRRSETTPAFTGTSHVE